MSLATMPLAGFTPRKKYFVGFDSDGCIFDSMEIKHRECFIPALIWKWNLQSVSRLARECHEFVNLYSKWRGINRFPALVRTLEMLAQRREAQARGFSARDIAELKNWIASERQLGNATLKRAVMESKNAVLSQTLDWSDAVNESIERVVYGVPPFPLVRESLARAEAQCDMIVVSQTPQEALQREWREHDIDGHVQAIFGQEAGSKEQHLAATCAGRYPPENTLVVGDAPGDMKAARAVNALFFPIIPGQEEASWERFYNEGYGHFIAGTFKGAYQDALIAEMEKALPEKAPWENV